MGLKIVRLKENKMFETINSSEAIEIYDFTDLATLLEFKDLENGGEMHEFMFIGDIQEDTITLVDEYNSYYNDAFIRRALTKPSYDSDFTSDDVVEYMKLLIKYDLCKHQVTDNFLRPIATKKPEIFTDVDIKALRDFAIALDGDEEDQYYLIQYGGKDEEYTSTIDFIERYGYMFNPIPTKVDTVEILTMNATKDDIICIDKQFDTEGKAIGVLVNTYMQNIDLRTIIDKELNSIEIDYIDTTIFARDLMYPIYEVRAIIDSERDALFKVSVKYDNDGSYSDLLHFNICNNRVSLRTIKESGVELLKNDSMKNIFKEMVTPFYTKLHEIHTVDTEDEYRNILRDFIM